ncbi:MAG: hypothetical protein ACI9CD_001053 [Candidatus Deianiraeaceae bacterium]|jgi:hypothetical protein
MFGGKVPLPDISSDTQTPAPNFNRYTKLGTIQLALQANEAPSPVKDDNVAHRQTTGKDNVMHKHKPSPPTIPKTNKQKSFYNM